MRARQSVMLLVVIGAVACQRGPGLCPPGMQADRAREVIGKSLWCKGKDPAAQRWIELWSPTERRQSCGYQAGKPAGEFLAWHKSGKPWIKGQYHGGLKEGPWTQWDNAGHPVADGEYRAGTLIAGAPVGMVALCEQQKP